MAESSGPGWLVDADVPPAELREPALPKVFFGADSRAIAEGRLAHHGRLLAEYERLHAALEGRPRVGCRAGDRPRSRPRRLQEPDQVLEERLG